MKQLVTWADVNSIHEPGSYGFQDGILDLDQAHIEAWERDLEGVWEVARHPDLARAGTWIPAVFHSFEDGPYED